MEEFLNETTNKKTRSARASSAQLSKMRDFFFANKGLAEGKFQVMNGKNEARKKWMELSEELNLMKGALKSPDQWQVVWRDTKSRISIKARQVRKAKSATGNKPITSPNLSEFDLRVIGIIGSEYVEGSKECADSIPEEEELQDELTRGNTAVLRVAPKVSSISTTEVDSSRRLLNEDKENLENSAMNDEFPENMGTDISAVGTNLESLVEEQSDTTKNSQPVLKTSATSYLRGQKRKMSRASVNTDFPDFTTGRNVNKPGVSGTTNRARLAETLHSAREHFRSISERQAEAMVVLANATKLQAEASMMNALAMTEMAKGVQKLADAATACAQNEAERVPVMARLVEVLENLLPTYLHE